MLLLYIIILIFAILQAERGIFDLVAFFALSKRLKKDLEKDDLSKQILKRALFIFIPVLGEQKIIEKTIIDLLQIDSDVFNLNVVIVTTIREVQENVKGSVIPTTKEIIQKSLSSGALAPFSEHIQIVQDPDPQGNMATQLNYALKKIRKSMSPDTLYLVYNADSLVSPTTYMRLNQLQEENYGISFAFQQPCAYIKDMNSNASGFLNALSLYQTWYCLGHESRRIQIYEKFGKKIGLWKYAQKLAVITGHGSGMSLGLHLVKGGYPADLMTEDLTFGFILSANEVPIFLLPALEVADVPSKFSVFIKQRSVWFWNYIEYFSCYSKMRKMGHKPLQLIVLLCHGIGAGAYWFFISLFIIFPIIIAIILNDHLLLGLILLNTFVFCIVPQYILLRKIPDILNQQGFSEHAENVRKVSFFQIFFPLCIILLTDSLGPWITVFQSFLYIFTGKHPKKYKTED